MTWWRWWRSPPVRDAVFAVVVTVVLLAGTYGEAHPGAGHGQDPVPGARGAASSAGRVPAGRGGVPGAGLAAPVAGRRPGRLDRGGDGLDAARLRERRRAAGPRHRPVRGGHPGERPPGDSAGRGDTGRADDGHRTRNPFGTSAGAGSLIPALVAAALFGGIAVANRRDYVASIQARAEDAAQRRIDEERLRIARELHDVVAHTMATINVQAGAAIHVADELPEPAVDALRAIREASKEGLRELRAILNVLRQADEADSTMPAPGLAQIDDLITTARSAGLPPP